MVPSGLYIDRGVKFPATEFRFSPSPAAKEVHILRDRRAKQIGIPKARTARKEKVSQNTNEPSKPKQAPVELRGGARLYAPCTDAEADNAVRVKGPLRCGGLFLFA